MNILFSILFVPSSFIQAFCPEPMTHDREDSALNSSVGRICKQARDEMHQLGLSPRMAGYAMDMLQQIKRESGEAERPVIFAKFNAKKDKNCRYNSNLNEGTLTILNGESKATKTFRHFPVYLAPNVSAEPRKMDFLSKEDQAKLHQSFPGAMTLKGKTETSKLAGKMQPSNTIVLSAQSRPLLQNLLNLNKQWGYEKKDSEGKDLHSVQSMFTKCKKETATFCVEEKTHSELHGLPKGADIVFLPNPLVKDENFYFHYFKDKDVDKQAAKICKDWENHPVLRKNRSKPNPVGSGANEAGAD